MTTSGRWYASSLAALTTFIAVIAGVTSHGPYGPWELVLLICLPVYYVVLATGSWVTRGDSLHRSWIVILMIVGALPAILTAAAEVLRWSNDGSWEPLPIVIVFLLLVAVFLRTATGLPARFAKIRVFGVPMMLIGAAMVAASPFLQITFANNENSAAVGWRVLAMQELWVTQYANVARSAFLGPTIHWLRWMYAPVGYLFYLAAVLACVALIVAIVKVRFSADGLKRWNKFPAVAAMIAGASAWVYDDIFWGWHFDLSEIASAAFAATLCWAIIIVAGTAFVGETLREGATPAAYTSLVLLQIPLSTFNIMLLPVYFEKGTVAPFPGLALLIVGLQVMSWGAVMLLFGAGEVRGQEMSVAAGVAK